MQRFVYIKHETSYYHPIKYVMGLIQRHSRDEICITEQATSDALIFDHENPNSEPVAIDFYAQYEDSTHPLSHEIIFTEKPVIRINDIVEDLVSTIFYMVNCLQERNAPSSNIDHFGRYKYSASYQYRFNCAEDNLVLNYIKELLQRWGLEVAPPRTSNVFLSHDIDALDGSWKHIVYYLVKQKRLITAFKALVRGLTGTPFYRNIPELLALHKRFGIKSTFFFIPVQGRGQHRIQNADYDIDEESELLQLIKSQGHSFGLHKSSKTSTLKEELKQLPYPTEYNRYHFLSHQPHKDWDHIEAANIKVDASLGFAEHIGFRNSYGLPFHPYNPVTKEAFRFLEVPLMVMDGTLWDYMGLSAADLGERVIRFIDQHKTDCVISILWHNTSLTEYPYPGLLEPYIEVLAYLDKMRFEFIEVGCISQKYTAPIKE